MKTQCGQQTDDAAWHLLGNLRERMLRRERMLARNVDTSRLSLDQTVANEAIELPARNSTGLEIRRTHDAQLPDELEHVVFLWSGHGEEDDTTRRGLFTSPDISTRRRTRNNGATVGTYG